MSRGRVVPAALALACVAALPLLADSLRRGAERCAFDGVRIAAPPDARVILRDGTVRAFCCVRCADRWVAVHHAPAVVRVTDGPTGGEIDAASAWFVRSLATWGGGAPDSIRAFARRGDAERHVRAYGGRLLQGADRPFGARWEEGHATQGP